MGEKKRRGARQRVGKADAAPWPSGFELAGRDRPPSPSNINEDVALLKSVLDRAPSYDPVLRAFEYIAQARIQGVQWGPQARFEGLPPPHGETAVMVPWWALEALVGAIQKARRGWSMDEAMGLKGAGRGKSGWSQSIEEVGEHLKRAYEVLHLMETRGYGKMRAISEVAARYGLSDDAVRRSVAKAAEAGLNTAPSPDE